MIINRYLETIKYLCMFYPNPEVIWYYHAMLCPSLMSFTFILSQDKRANDSEAPNLWFLSKTGKTQPRLGTQFYQTKLRLKTSELRSIVMATILTIMSTTSWCQSHYHHHHHHHHHHQAVGACNRSGTCEFSLEQTLGHQNLCFFQVKWPPWSPK